MKVCIVACPDMSVWPNRRRRRVTVGQVGVCRGTPWADSAAEKRRGLAGQRQRRGMRTRSPGWMTLRDHRPLACRMLRSEIPWRSAITPSVSPRRTVHWVTAVDEAPPPGISNSSPG